MTKAELWEIIIRRNPSFQTREAVTISTAGVEKLFNLAYEKGREQGIKEGRNPFERRGPENPFRDLFK